ncbi:hypothetical protein DENSPDRAFT_83038 [Dentipellis sp. KUC8613]|nr:hypothetical protein DENSPDRAFT_83038 [Dentipellis sp. KUC8613]
MRPVRASADKHMYRQVRVRSGTASILPRYAERERDRLGPRFETPTRTDDRPFLQLGARHGFYVCFALRCVFRSLRFIGDRVPCSGSDTLKHRRRAEAEVAQGAGLVPGGVVPHGEHAGNADIDGAACSVKPDGPSLSQCSAASELKSGVRLLLGFLHTYVHQIPRVHTVYNFDSWAKKMDGKLVELADSERCSAKPWSSDLMRTYVRAGEIGRDCAMRVGAGLYVKTLMCVRRSDAVEHICESRRNDGPTYQGIRPSECVQNVGGLSSERPIFSCDEGLRGRRWEACEALDGVSIMRDIERTEYDSMTETCSQR